METGAMVATGPTRLLQRLTDAGAKVRAVGSVARGSIFPGDLDVVVADDDADLESLLAAIRRVGGVSRMTVGIPTAAQLRDAQLWQFGTADAPLDVFVERHGQ